MTLNDSRIIQLEGAANVRDLGGLPTADGRIVRRGRVFRSDVLYRLTENDALVLRPLGFRTVIDLRSAGEVRNYPESPLKVAGVSHVNVPIVTDEPNTSGSLLEDCLLLLRNVRDGFRTVFRHLAQDQYPLVINCFAGKDRTGITSALILGALGVSDDIIVADYALSETHMFRHMHIHRGPDQASVDPGVLPDWLFAKPETMEATLHFIAQEWGSVGGYLEAIGVPSEWLSKIRGTLIES